MSNTTPLNASNLDILANDSAAENDSYLSINYASYIQDLMQTLSVFAIGVPLFRAPNECIGCLFILNSDSESLSATKQNYWLNNR